MLCIQCTKLAILPNKRICVRCQKEILNNLSCICDNCSIDQNICSICLKKIMFSGSPNKKNIRRSGGCKSCGGG